MDGVFSIVIGVWILSQLFGGDLLGRLNLL